MESICVTGVSPANLQMIAGILHDAGMAHAKPAVRDASFDMDSWHRHVESQSSAAGTLQSIPGKLWEQVAADIFLANMGTPIWGWANQYATWQLDFWLNFTPTTYFILVYVSPEEFAAQAIREQGNQVDLSLLFDEWQKYHRHILQFHNRNPARSLLVSITDCLQAPAAFVQTCAKQWDLPLQKCADVPARQLTDPVSLFLALSISGRFPHLAELRHELDVTALRFSHSGPPSELSALEHAIQHQLSQQHHISELTALADQERDNAAELQELLRAERESHAAATQQLQAAQKSHSQETERLLMQFAHEVKNLHQENEILLNTLQQQLTQALAQHDAEKQAWEMRHTQIEHEHTHALQKLQQQLKVAQQQSHDAAQGANQSKLEIQALSENLARQVQLGEAAADQIAGLQTQLAQAYEDQHADIQRLLLEVHKAHQETEHYVQNYSTASARLHASDLRWQRLEARNPDLFDYDRIEIENHPSDDAGVIHCRIIDFRSGPMEIPVLEFKFSITGQQAGISFTRGTGGMTPSMVWPSIIAMPSQVGMSGAATTQAAKNMARISELRTREWRLVQIIPQLLTSAFARGELDTASIRMPVESLISTLHSFHVSLAKTLPAFRFDAVTLKREQVNPDYEHLWIHVLNPSFGDAKWGELGFRISCADVRPDSFGKFPKLEFPGGSAQSVLDSWFVESTDDFGNKLELRFAQPDAMDIAIWQELSTHDQNLIFALVKRIPGILAELKSQGQGITRAWSEWHNMAGDIVRIMSTQVKPASPKIAIQNV